MDPPSRAHGKRRAVSAQTHYATRYTSDGSPTPFAALTDVAPQGSFGARRPRTSHTITVGCEEGDGKYSPGAACLNIELAECVETKTITTTTTTRRSYPPLLLQKPQALENLDPKKYPLALKPTPSDIASFEYEVDGRVVNFHEDDSEIFANEISQVESQSSSRPESQAAGSFEHASAEYQRPERTSKKKPSLGVQRRSLRGLADASSSRSSSLGRGMLKTKKGNNGLDPDIDQFSSEHKPRHKVLGLSSVETTLPATPDPSEQDGHVASRGCPLLPSFFGTSYTPQSGLSQSDTLDDAPSPSDSSNGALFSSAVATPPVAEFDLEPFESVNVALAQAQASAQRPTINTLAAQNASLPSPGLSPTLAATGTFGTPFSKRDQDVTTEDLVTYALGEESADSQETLAFQPNPSRSIAKIRRRIDEPQGLESQAKTFLEARSMLDTFDSMPDDMKSFMMYQFLRRCSRTTLHVIANVVNPALKCDFLVQLPLELGLHILSFLDCKDLCRASRVSKQWRNTVDTNETGWKELLDYDGFILPPGELERAIHEGWGWQNPCGASDFEQDLSARSGSSGDSDVTVLSSRKLDLEQPRKVRSTTKRKRVAGATSSERAKRRAINHEFAGRAQDILSKYPYRANFSKSEGPLTAANAAAVAVPDPELGLPGLRKLNLFKSLYRRRYVIKRNWTSGKVEPHHLAFPAHPSHVITCLQFDDDKIITGSDDTLIHVYDTRTGQLRKKLEGHDGGVWALQYEGNVLVSGSTDRSVRVWDIEKGLCTQVFHGHTSTVRCLQILMPEDTGRLLKGRPVMIPEKPLIITGSRDSQLRVWKLPEQGSKRYIQTGPPANDADCPYFVRVLHGHSSSVRAIAAHQDTLVSGSYDCTVRVWKISTGEILHRLLGHTMKVYSVVLDKKRNRCISGSMDNFVKIWCLQTGACLYTLEGHTSLVGLLDLRDERLVSAAADSTLRIWDPENGQCKSTLSAHTGAITCFQHDGQKVISGSDRTLKMWNVKTGECIKDLLTDLSGVWQVKFDDRRCVAAVQRDNLTFVEVLDFGASRDGVPASQRGSRILLNNEITDRIMEEEDA